MKFLRYAKDGGPESHVSGLFIIEIKRLFSIVLLHFSPGSRDAYHSHAFDALSWVLKGELTERLLNRRVKNYKPSIVPVLTRRSTFHRVVSIGDTWALSFRGPWAETWREYLPEEQRLITLTNGRKPVAHAA